MNSKSNNNLKSWKPGQSGNPAGRPIGSISLVAKLKEQLKEHPENGDRIVDRWIKDAVKGNDKARSSIIDRIDGRAADKVEILRKIRVDVIHRIAIAFSNSIRQAGISKAQAREVIDNMERLLKADTD